MADADVDDRNVVFDGNANGLASDVFIRSIRRRVIGQGIAKDDELVAQVAVSCLGGSALDWYEQQSEEVQDSWKLLRQAMIAQWPTGASAASPYSNVPSPFRTNSSSDIPTQASAPPPAAAPPPPPPRLPMRNVPAPAPIRGNSSSSLPTPAAAPPPPLPGRTVPASAAAPRYYATQAPPPNSRSTVAQGRIRVCSEAMSVIGYVSSMTHQSGQHLMKRNPSDAAIVHLIPSGRYSYIHFANTPQGDFLGVTWAITGVKGVLSQLIYDGSACWAAVATVYGNPGPGARRSTALTFNGETGTQVWTVTKNELIQPSWEIRSGIRCDLVGVLGAVSGSLHVANTFEGFVNSNLPASNWSKVHFEFEPM